MLHSFHRCVGGRIASAGSADKQGTPVQNRDGPAAVTERKKDGPIYLAIVLP